jgi:DNA-binding winged helix-turn-helix (wHTH) protein/TolB-like protein/tetratricopeptide (TPR) repeat protein
MVLKVAEGTRLSGESTLEYEFNGFRIDPAGRRLCAADGSTVDISARAFDVLLFLVEHRGEDISKEKLMAAAWPDTVVEENNLNQAITALRRVLGDQRREPRFIMTVLGRGYRFVAKIAQPTTQASPPLGSATETPIAAAARHSRVLSRRWGLVGLLLILATAAALVALNKAPVTTNEPPMTSLAVLPFRPILHAQSNPALELGMVDALIGQIGQLPGVTVRPLSTVAGFTDVGRDPIAIGRQLEVAAVLEGTLQTDGNRIRVTARLLRVSDGHLLWSGSFDEAMRGIFEVQDSIAQLVMQTLAERLGTKSVARSVPPPTLNPDAYQLYASGVFNLQRRDIDGTAAAARNFEAAIRADPNYALAWALLANVRAMQSVFGILPAQSALPEAKAAAQRAIELDSTLAQGQAAMGQVLVQYEHKFAEGEKYYERARRLNPNVAIVHLWTAINYLCMGRTDEAMRETQRAQQLEAGNLAYSANAARVQYYARNYAESAALARRLLDLVPTFDDARSILGRTLLQQHEFDQALELFKARTKPSPGSLGDVGRAYAAAGRRSDAYTEIKALRAKGTAGFGVAYDIAAIHALLGEIGPACAALQQALRDRSQAVGLLRLDPDFDRMRGEQCLSDVEHDLYSP